MGDDARRVFIARNVPVVFEDEHLIVVEKPSGLLTAVPPPRDGRPAQNRDNLFDLVKTYVRQNRRARGAKTWIIHRLDKEASGLLVFATSERAFEFLKEEFRGKRAHRLYSAVVEGELGVQPARDISADAGTRLLPPQPVSGTIQSFLAEDHTGLVRSFATPGEADRALGSRRGEEGEPRLAVTHWQVVKAGHGRTLVQVRLETGRKHQIRVHMGSLGKPIVGDRRYNAASDPLGRLCLHAFELGFAHPVTGQSLRFRSPTPGSFFGLVGRGEAEPTPRSAPLAPAATTPAPAATIAPSAHPELQGETTPASDALTKPEPAPTLPAIVEESPTLAAPVAPAATSSWDHVAGWYDDLIEDRGSDHHERVILPGTLRLLHVNPGDRVLDVACGQGVLCRRLAAQGISVTGVDAAPRLIDAARRIPTPAGAAAIEYAVADARALADVVSGPFDAIACVMALMNMDPLTGVCAGVASLLRPGGRFVGVILHPAFRAPGQTSWQWEGGEARRGVPAPPRKGRHPRDEQKPSGARARQYRRVDGYLTPMARDIVMNPGAAAHGKPAVTTLTYHRPISSYVRALAESGLLVDAMEEWPSLRVSQPGGRADEENRARREIPMFLAFRAVKSPQIPA